jgi:isoleucyl-tRNA synthetase
MMTLSAILFGKKPFENVLTTGTILAEDGQKMSKSKGNFPDPLKVVEKYGADALRFYLISSTLMNAENFNFSEKGLEEVYKKVLLLLYNVSNFYCEYKKDSDKDFKEPENLMDLWILSRTEELRRVVEERMENYDLIKACNEIRKFIDDLSTWYVRNVRDRFNEGDEYVGKTLRYVLEKLVKIIAPILPFSAEKIYRDMNGNSSVHLEEYPMKDNFENTNMNVKMDKLRNQVSVP